MAFPQVAGTSVGATEASNTTTHTITLPTGIVAGNLVVICFSVDAAETPEVTTGTGWTRAAYNAVGTASTLAIFWKKFTVDGPETVVITTTTEQSSHVCFRITGFDPIVPIKVSTGAENTNTNADPDALQGDYGARDYLWIAVAGHDSTVVASGAPADFGNLLTQAAASTAGASTSTARREYNTANSYDPGAFTSSAEDWAAYTIIVNPLGCTGIGCNYSTGSIANSGLIQEGFEKSSGYDMSGWTEELGSNDTMIEDSTAVSRPTGGGTQCLELKAVTPDFTSSVYYTFGASQTKVYGTAYIRVETATMASNATESLLTLNGGGQSPIIIGLWKAPDDADKIHFISRVYSNTTYNDAVFPAYGTAITTGVWYRFYFYYDLDNHLFEVKVQPDGGSITSMSSGSLTDTHSTSITGVTLGSVFINTFTVYYDNIYVNKHGYNL